MSDDLNDLLYDGVSNEMESPLTSLIEEPDVRIFDPFMSETNSGETAKEVSASATEDETKKKARARKKAYQNAASRKARLKRKAEREELEERNKALEAEQKSFRKTIAGLQNEIQTLKSRKFDHGRSDLKIENTLLRTEVKRYKAFVNHVNNMMNNFPEHNFSDQEKAELVRDGLESCVGQALGMCYLSASDKGWDFVEYYPQHEVLKGVRIVCYWQLLPLGCEPEETTRINIRTDVFGVSSDLGDLLSETLLSHKAFFEHTYEETCKRMGGKVKKKRLDMNSLTLDFNSLKLNEDGAREDKTASAGSTTPFNIFQITETDNSDENPEVPLEYILLNGGTQVELEESFFRKEESTIFNKTKMTAKVHVTTSAPAKIGERLAPKPDDTVRYDGEEPCFSAEVTPLKIDSKWGWTSVSSFPLTGNRPWMARGCGLDFVETDNSPQGAIPSTLMHSIDGLCAWINEYKAKQKN